MTAIATVSQADLVGRSRDWPIRTAAAIPTWRQCAAGLLVVACMTVPNACINAKVWKLSLVTKMTVHRLMAPSA